MASTNDPLLTTAQVAEQWQCSTTYVAREARAHRLPHSRLGVQFRFRQSDVDAYIAAHTIPAADLVSAPRRRSRKRAS